jgi:integrase
MVTEWLELLAQRPAKLPKEDRDLPLPALVAKYEGSEADRLELKTIRTHLAALSAIWNKGQEAGTINDVLQNPFKARKSLSGSHEDEQGTEYTLEELEAILSLPVFTSGDRPAPLLGDACYWIPLLLQWTGARPEEVAQLMLSDIFQDEASGQWVLRITDDGVHPVKGKRQLKSAPRDPLIPQALIELGLPAYVEHLRHQGETALFPTLRVKSSTKGYLSPLFGEWWSGYLKQNGIHLAPQRGKTRRPLRDFRTAWATQARADRIPEEAMQYLMGHSTTGKGTTRTYGSQHPHARWMSVITYSKLDLSRVKPWGKP